MPSEKISLIPWSHHSIWSYLYVFDFWLMTVSLCLIPSCIVYNHPHLSSPLQCSCCNTACGRLWEVFQTFKKAVPNAKNVPNCPKHLSSNHSESSECVPPKHKADQSTTEGRQAWTFGAHYPSMESFDFGIKTKQNVFLPAPKS